jgi:hypothetical protein
MLGSPDSPSSNWSIMLHLLHPILIALHVLAGSSALIMGILTILSAKHVNRHKRYGLYFLRLLAIVVVTGLAGLLFFHANSFLLMLTLLSGYVGYAGYRTVQLRQRRSSAFDVMVAGSVLVAGAVYVGWLRQSEGNWAPSVVYSTLAALAMVTVYDLCKHFWLQERLKRLWIYEHIYKMVSAFSALLSAFIGTVLPNYKPYSQIGPSVVCVWLIVYLIWRRWLQEKRKQDASTHFTAQRALRG